MDFNRLPLEIQCHIFSFLSLSDYDKLSNVSKTWANLITEPCCRQHIEIDGRVHSPQVISQLLERYYALKHIKFTRLDDWIWIVRCPLRRGLRELEFDACKFSSEDIIQQLIRPFPLIRVCKILNCLSVSNYCILQISGWELLRNLHVDLQFGYINNLHGDGYTRIAELCNKLEELAIRVKLTDESLSSIIDIRGEKLKSLRLLNCLQLSDVSYQSLSKCINLTHLEISSAYKMTDVGLKAVKALLHIQALIVTWASKISTTGFVELFNDNKFLCLQRLDLKRCENLDNNGVSLMAKRLKELDLSYCVKITDQGLQAIVNNCRYLEVVHLCALSSITGHYRGQVCFQLPNLIYLNLQACYKMDEEVLLLLKENYLRLFIIEPHKRNEKHEVGVNF